MSFQDHVIYQIYPKSFRDTTGNGVGDLRGVIEKIPYIASLGVDMVWFNPFFPSPQRDNGYDVADYRSVDPAMGTMADLEELIAGLAEHGIGVMFDMVFNHTSTEHEWFQRALAGERKYQDYYIIRPPTEDGGLPTNWQSKFGGPAWSPFGETGDYYLHLFDRMQADLNWRNPEVRAEMADIVNFWRAKGVHGFRFDVVNLIGKSAELLSAGDGTDGRHMYTDGPDVDRYLQELNRASFGQDPDAVTVGEMSSTTVERCVGYSNPENRELDMVFSFHHLKVDYRDGKKWTLMPFDFPKLKATLHEWAEGMQAGGGWNALFWNNHDQPRAVDRFGNATFYREESATMLASVIHLLRGTPFVHMGEEIGMTDPVYERIEDYNDVEARNAHAALMQEGLSAEDAFDIVHSKARDNARTPMQWSDEEHAGFSTVTPWLRPTNQAQISVAEEEQSGRILRHYRQLIRLRHEMPLIAEGTYEPWALEHPEVFAYLRRWEGEALLVLNNFFGEQTTVEIPAEFGGVPGAESGAGSGAESGAESGAARVLIGNYDDDPRAAGAGDGAGSGTSGASGAVAGADAAAVTLRPYETLALHLPAA